MTKNSVDEIVSQINRFYPAKPYNYEVRIFGGNVADAEPDVMFNCSAINVPGVNLSITQDKRYGIGNMKQLPIGKSYTEINLTFYESEFEVERAYFVNWVDSIYDKTTRRFSFYKDFVKTINIIQYDKKGNKTYECFLRECFPSNISQLDKAYSAGDTIPQFNVNIQFYELEEVFYEKTGSSGFGGLFSFLR